MSTTSALELESFVLRHSSHHLPVVLVTSGGTAADLEVRAVRSLDNFSTGLRGAISVEEFLKRGYAVIHLWRIGSASPYGRLLSHILGMKQANHGITNEALGNLLDASAEADQDGGLPQVLDEQDPWLTDTRPHHAAMTSLTASGTKKDDGSLALHRRLAHDGDLQRAWRERNTAMKEGRLLTVSFRTVEEYLEKLELCSKHLNKCHSLAMMYLAAAVSDFYIPNKTEHKIQSSEYSNGGELVLKLQPVPKTLGKVRTEWSPKAFCVSFKLETDPDILRKKAEGAVLKYGVHMVIGNLLESRHDKVAILYNDTEDDDVLVTNWPMKEVSKASAAAGDLEDALIDFCVAQHFSYISRHFHGDDNHDALVSRYERLIEQKRQVQRRVFWRRVRNGALQVAGTAVGMAITYTISMALQRRMFQSKG